MRRLLILCNKFPFPPRDGSSIAMASNIRGLSSQGLEITVLALNTKKHFVAHLPDNDEPGHVTWNPVNVDTSPSVFGAILNLLFSKESYMVSRFNLSKVRSVLQSILNSQSFDIAIVDGLFMMPYANMLRDKNIRIVLRGHNVEHHIWNQQIDRESSILKKWYLGIQNRRLKKFEDEAALYADHVVPITREDAQYFSQLIPESTIHTMPCGINLEEYPNYPSAEPDVFHIGAMDWTPNVDGIQWFEREVWEKITAQYPEAVFNLAGRYSEKLDLHQPNKGFFVHGRVDSAREFYSRHGIFIVPLHVGSGMRIKVLEAMAFGKAIVSTSVGIEGIPVEHGYDVLIADSAHDFADAVVRLLRDKDLRLTLGKNARVKAIANFDEKRLAVELLSYLSQPL